MSALARDTGPAPEGGHRRASLGRNVGAGYALQVANYLIPLVTLPFLVRTLGAGPYGRVAFAYAVTYFLVLFVDAGFNNRASQVLSSRARTAERLSSVFAATQLIKLGLVAIALLLLLGLIAAVPRLALEPALYLASFMTVLGSLLFPTWLFQGLEVMPYTTACSVGGRLIVTAGLFALVRDGGDVALAALLQCSGTFVSGLLALPVIYRRLGLTLRPPWPAVAAEIRLAWRESRALAVSEFLTTALNNSSVFLLGLFHPAALVGGFAAVEKLARAAANGLNPVLQALFPRMSALWHSDPAEARRVACRWTRRFVALALLGAAALFLLAPLVLTTLFGPDWRAQTPLLRLFALWFLFTLTNATAGQFWLLSAGHRTSYARCLLAIGVAQPLLMLPAAAYGGALGAVAALAAAEIVACPLLWSAAWRRHRSPTP